MMKRFTDAFNNQSVQQRVKVQPPVKFLVADSQTLNRCKSAGITIF